MKNIMLILVCAGILLACSSGDEPEPGDPQMTSVDPPTNSTVQKMGTFVSFAHSLAGKSVLYIDGSNNRVLRLEEFHMTQGPDVYVFLSKANNYSQANVVELTRLVEGYTDSSINITVDSAIDLDTYKFVLVYCVQYNSLFGYTELQ